MPVMPDCVNVGSVAEQAGDLSGRRQVVGERVVYDSPDVRVGRVDVALPDGERVWRHVVRAASVALVDDADRVLLVWRHHYVQDRWGWELPGGLVDEDEDPAEAAVRELEDQTGTGLGS
jgi:8-oxo-dGDP phosphatase